jgi:hypothetical protein
MHHSKSRKNQYAFLAAGLVSFMFSACGKNKDTETKAIAASSVADLKLSSSLKLEIPDSLARAGGRSSALAMTKMERKRSREACNAVNDMNMMLSNLSAAASMACHLEAESAQIQFGKKYKIALTEGGEETDLRVWVDNSEADKLTMYACMGDQLQQKIVIDGSNSTGSSGSIGFGGSDEGGSFAMALKFDFKDQAVKSLSGQFTYDMPSVMTFAQDNELVLRNSGVSVMKVARKGSGSGLEFSQSSAVKHNGTQGQALMSIDVSGQTFAYRESFDSDGYALEEPSSVAEEVKLLKADLPSTLAAGFSIPALSGWDCATEETITVNTDTGATGAAHAQCDAEDDSSSADPSCDGDDFAYGEPLED